MTTIHDTGRNDQLDDSGVRVVGATADDDSRRPPPQTTPPPPHRAAPTMPAAMTPLTRHRDVLPPVVPAVSSGPSRQSFRLVALIATLGVLGTLVFGVLFATQGSSSSSQNPAVNQAAQAFLTDFFNFNAKTVDADFSAVTNMATGQFATQAKQFFNTSIRQALEKALAESRGQTRALYVQSESANAATLYAVVDQTYVNNKISTPQADVVRLVISLQNLGGTWKISERHRARGRHAGQRRLPLGIGRLQRPRSVATRAPPRVVPPGSALGSSRGLANRTHRLSGGRRSGSRNPVRWADGAASPTIGEGCVRVCG